jgi:hypothetical protein
LGAKHRAPTIEIIVFQAFYEIIIIDGFVISRKLMNFVIPAEAEIQSFPSRPWRDGPRLSPG